MGWIDRLGTRRLVTARPAETVSAVVERMVEHGVGSALVVEKEKLLGIFSERDVMTRVIAPGRDPAMTRVEDVCTREPRVIRRDADLAECARLVKSYGVRHVPVVDAGGSPVGIISVRDFLHYVLDELESLMEKAYRERRLEQLTDPYGAVGRGSD